MRCLQYCSELAVNATMALSAMKGILKTSQKSLIGQNVSSYPEISKRKLELSTVNMERKSSNDSCSPCLSDFFEVISLVIISYNQNTQNLTVFPT